MPDYIAINLKTENRFDIKHRGGDGKMRDTVQTNKVIIGTLVVGFVLMISGPGVALWQNKRAYGNP